MAGSSPELSRGERRREERYLRFMLFQSVVLLGSAAAVGMGGLGVFLRGPREGLVGKRRHFLISFVFSFVFFFSG